jgi:hypothetical protein
MALLFPQLEDYEQQLLEMANISREEYLATLRRFVIRFGASIPSQSSSFVACACLVADLNPNFCLCAEKAAASQGECPSTAASRGDSLKFLFVLATPGWWFRLRCE